MTSAAWLVMSMNGGWYFTRSSISASSPFTSPPRIGGMISKLISGSFAFAKGSVHFMDGRRVSAGPGGVNPQDPHHPGPLLPASPPPAGEEGEQQEPGGVE